MFHGPPHRRALISHTPPERKTAAFLPLLAIYLWQNIEKQKRALAPVIILTYQLRMSRNLSLYPWFKFVQSLVFWQATWFLYFESQLSAAEAILLYVVYDIATTIFEVPSGYMSDRLGRKLTLICAGISGVGATTLLVVGDGFFLFAVANILLGASAAFASGTDSALLYESLHADGRATEVEQAELTAWRFGFAALALSALSGGWLALYDPIYPYIGTALSAVLLLVLTAFLREPPHGPVMPHRENLNTIAQNLTQPTLIWLLCLALVMYVFSHIPFVFGQPFIREALTNAGYAAQTPLISGGVTFTMMILSILVSLIALPLRTALGLPTTLLLAFGMQIALTFALSASNGLFVITLLFFRMVPDSLSQPFIKARIQPLLKDSVRATYMSLQSLAGRVIFAVTLSLSAGQTADDAPLPYDDMQVILMGYVSLGVVVFAALALTAKAAKV
jgi:MFS family permease